MMNRWIVFLFCGALVVSCYKAKTVEPVDPIVIVGPCADTVSFSNEIMPEIIDLSCNTAGCHDATASGGYTLLNHSQVSSNSAIIYKAISHDVSVIAMPYFSTKLADSLIQKFDCWIQQGTLDN